MIKDQCIISFTIILLSLITYYFPLISHYLWIMYGHCWEKIDVVHWWDLKVKDCQEHHRNPDPRKAEILDWPFNCETFVATSVTVI